MRQCPGKGCGYKRAEHEIDRSILNFACPRCRQFNIKEFVPVPDPEPEVDEPVHDYGAHDYNWWAKYHGTD